MIVISEADLRALVERILAAAGLAPPAAAQVAEPLVEANLRGVDSHGVQLLPYYVGQIERGDVNPRAAGHIVSENGACLVYDSERGLGQITARACCAHAARLAARHGLGMAVARETNHFGAAFFWAQTISAQGLIGIVLCDSSMQVPPWQGREPRLGTNPIAMSVPSPDGRGWLLDMATTTVAYAKIEQLWLKGHTTLPQGWALDSAGAPTTDLAQYMDGGLLMPLGGYKGSGLAVLVEILSGVLAGGPVFSTGVTGVRQPGRATCANQAFLAIDVARFLPLEEFHARMEWLVAQIKSAPPAQGYGEVLVAGDPEWRAREERRRGGIPIPPGVWRRILEVAEHLHVQKG